MPRWSKKTDELVRAIAPGVRPSLQSELGNWLEGSSRFRDFVSANQVKIRKKLSTTDEEARQDVRAELVVAHALLADRRFVLAFEAYGARQIGPDFTVTFRTNQQFNLEVTRLRAESDPARLANVIAGKLRQLPGDRPNALVIAARELAEDTVDSATRLLKAHNDTSDDAFFTRRGFRSARDFYAQYLHLSATIILGETAAFVSNREARRPITKDLEAALIACLSAASP